MNCWPYIYEELGRATYNWGNMVLTVLVGGFFVMVCAQLVGRWLLELRTGRLKRQLKEAVGYIHGQACKCAQHSPCIRCMTLRGIERVK